MDIYLGFSRCSLQFLLYHMAAVILCGRLLMFLISCSALACLASTNLMCG